MDTNTGIIIKLCVFALDIFIIIFNFITLKHYLPPFGQNKLKHVETKNKGLQTYMAGDMDLKAEKKQAYMYRSSALGNKPQNSSYTRNNSNITRHCQKCYGDRDKDYKKDDKYIKSSHCELCKEGKRHFI